MAIKIKEMHTVICDRCGYDAFADTEYSCWPGEGLAREMANYDDWQEIDEKDYCPMCLECDDDGAWRPKANTEEKHDDD